MKILGLPDVGRDALMRAALDPPDIALRAWERWRRAADSAAVDPVAARWMPLIAWNLRHAPLDPTSARRLADARLGSWASNVCISDAAQPALDLLAASHIPFVLLKGAALIRTAYLDAGVRPIGDVDLLVEPARARDAAELLQTAGWQQMRPIAERDWLLAHGIDLRKGEHGALDLHWFLLHECCWHGVDSDVWQRKVALPSAGHGAFVLNPADQVLHLCIHGIRWSPVHAGHWMADVVHVIRTAREPIDWNILVEEAARRRLGLQLSAALQAVRTLGPVPVPDTVFRALDRQPVTWWMRPECALKPRPVVSAGGLLVIWCGWRRSWEAARTSGQPRPSFRRYLSAALGTATPGLLTSRLARHMASKLTGRIRPGRRRQGRSAQAAAWPELLP